VAKAFAPLGTDRETARSGLVPLLGRNRIPQKPPLKLIARPSTRWRFVLARLDKRRTEVQGKATGGESSVAPESGDGRLLRYRQIKPDSGGSRRAVSHASLTGRPVWIRTGPFCKYTFTRQTLFAPRGIGTSKTAGKPRSGRSENAGVHNSPLASSSAYKLDAIFRATI